MDQLRIGLTMRVVEAVEYAEKRDALAQDWPGFMHQVLPEYKWMPMPNLGSGIASYVQSWNLSGFIITGGNNLFECPERDETELALISYALANDIPIFGVCRGFQIMAHYFGFKIQPCSNHAATTHEVIINGDKHMVNSYHDNCGPVEMQPPLMAFARDLEGRIEGFRHVQEPLMAIMWHPERECQATDLNIKMIRKFFGLL